MRFEQKSIPLDSINLENKKYKISTDGKNDNLADSIDSIGLLCPPILQQENHQYIVVSGFRRVKACRTLGWYDVDSRIVEPDSGELDCLKISISDNLLNRSLNLLEQSIAVHKLSGFFEDEKDLIHISETIGMRVHPSYIKKIINLHTYITELQQSIISGIIPLTIATEIGKLEKSSAKPMIHIFNTLRPTLNHQKEILILIKEISKIKNLPISDLIFEEAISNILNDEALNRNQKIQHLRSTLKRMRYPVISNFTDHFNQIVQKLNLPKDIRLIPPENFEDTSFSMILQFKSLSEIRSLCEVLNDIIDYPEFRSILSKEIANS